MTNPKNHPCRDATAYGQQTGGGVGAPAAAVDVRDMTCAQALAVVAKAAAQLTDGQALEVRYNTDDVNRDVLAWARERGHRVHDASPGLLALQRGSSA